MLKANKSTIEPGSKQITGYIYYTDFQLNYSYCYIYITYVITECLILLPFYSLPYIFTMSLMFYLVLVPIVHHVIPILFTWVLVPIVLLDTSLTYSFAWNWPYVSTQKSSSMILSAFLVLGCSGPQISQYTSQDLT